MFKKLLATGIIAGSVALMAPTAAGAATTTYQLTRAERRHACGDFVGTIIFSDGSSLDCSTGVATLPSN